jgi:hypothetical protein
MNTVKTGLLVALIALSASAARALDAPYSVDGGYTGTATLKISGGCKASITYANARYGEVYDAYDDYVGWGLVTASGQLVTLERDSSIISNIYDTVTGSGTSVYFEDMGSNETAAAIAAIAGCGIDTIVSNLSSRDSYKTDAPKGTQSASLQYSFGGYTVQVIETKGDKQYITGKKYTGKVTFKATRLLPI